MPNGNFSDRYFHPQAVIGARQWGSKMFLKLNPLFGIRIYQQVWFPNIERHKWESMVPIDDFFTKLKNNHDWQYCHSSKQKTDLIWSQVKCVHSKWDQLWTNLYAKQRLKNKLSLKGWWFFACQWIMNDIYLTIEKLFLQKHKAKTFSHT